MFSETVSLTKYTFSIAKFTYKVVFFLNAFDQQSLEVFSNLLKRRKDRTFGY